MPSYLSDEIVSALQRGVDHANDAGLRIGDDIKRVEVEGAHPIWYNWLSGAKRWEQEIFWEPLELIYQAGIKQGGCDDYQTSRMGDSR